MPNEFQDAYEQTDALYKYPDEHDHCCDHSHDDIELVQLRQQVSDLEFKLDELCAAATRYIDFRGRDELLPALLREYANKK